MQKKVILSVTNDLISDQRMNKICLSLNKWDYDVCLIGRRFSETKTIEKREYKTHRMKIFFRDGPLFYAEYNIKLFFKLLFTKADIIVANDLDVLLASFLATKFKKSTLVYDSHEYFTELPELIGRNAKKVWLKIEQFILPKVKHTYTVCESIANEYNRLYNVEMKIVRNLPLKEKKTINAKEKIDFGNKKIILYQGALNVGRGIEHIIEAMVFIENAIFVIIGDGDIAKELKQQTENLNLLTKVKFISKIPYNELFAYTKIASVGISLQEDRGLSYRYVLPNRLFDYIKAELPILTSNLPEMQKITDEFDIGISIETMNIELITKSLKELLSNKEKQIIWKENLKKAAAELHWENEEKELFKVYKNIHSQLKFS